PVRHAHDQAAPDDPPDVDVIGHEAARWRYLAREPDLARPQCAAPARRAGPAEEEPHELPHGIEPEAPGHDRVPREVAAEEPELGANVQLGDQVPLAVAAAFRADGGDAIHHEHVRKRELGIALTEQFPPGTGKQFFPAEAVLFPE